MNLHPPRTRRPAYTLFELIVVLAIIVVAGAIVIPSMAAMSPYYKVNGAADMVRAAWAEARAHAMEQGRPYRFSVEHGGSFFRVAPDRDDYWSSGSGPSDDPDGPGFILEKPLPGGVRFALNGEAPPASSSVADQGKDENRKPSGNWDTVCVFLFDGTAKQDVKVVFQVRGARPVMLQLRGLTGAATTTVMSTK
jgi:type II secretory pathway pseudopilin PulG